MMNKEKLVKSVMMAFIALVGADNAANAASESKSESKEKCYGIVRAGMNDCATSKASCAGSATVDSQRDAYVFMPKGLCKKLVGGELKAK